MSEVWLIANAASAAGFALAEAALKAGAQIVAGAREPARLTALAARHDGRVLAVPLDLAAEATVYAAIDAALTAFGRLDVVVNMVDKVEALPVAEMDDATLRKQFERHFFGVVGLAHAVLPILHEQGGAGSCMSRSAMTTVIPPVLPRAMRSAAISKDWRARSRATESRSA